MGENCSCIDYASNERFDHGMRMRLLQASGHFTVPPHRLVDQRPLSAERCFNAATRYLYLACSSTAIEGVLK